MFLHVFYSWLLAQLFNLLLLAALGWLDSGLSFAYADVADKTLIFLATAILSLPCLLFGWLFLGIIVYSRHTFTMKFSLWMGTSAVLVLINIWAVLWLFGVENFHSNYFVAIPAILAIWLSSIIRVQQLRKLISTEDTLPSNDRFIEEKN